MPNGNKAALSLAFVCLVIVPGFVMADSILVVSALGLNVLRDRAAQSESQNSEASAPTDSKSAASKDSEKNTNATTSKSENNQRPDGSISRSDAKVESKSKGALGFSIIKRFTERKSSSADEAGGSEIAPSVVVTDTDKSNKFSEEGSLENQPSIKEHATAERNQSIFGTQQSSMADESVGLVNSQVGSGFGSVAETVFMINRRKEPQFVSKALALSTQSENPLANVSYSWYWGDVYTAVKYQGNSATDDGFVTGLEDQLIQNEISRSQDHIRVYPVNWLQRFSRLQLSYGMFYSHRSSQQLEQGGDDVSFNNKIMVNADQYGLQTSFLYRGKLFRFRGFVHLPVTVTSVEESYYFNESGVIATHSASASSSPVLSYEASLDVLLKTEWGVSFLLSGAYEVLPLQYSRVSVSRNIDDQIEFGRVDYDAENRSLELSSGIYFDALDIVNIAPFVAATARRDTLVEKGRSDTLITDNLDFQIGFSGQF